MMLLEVRTVWSCWIALKLLQDRTRTPTSWMLVDGDDGAKSRADIVKPRPVEVPSSVLDREGGITQAIDSY